MTSRPFRRANFISPFGPGAISVAPDGTAAITAGLDHWYDPPPNREKNDYDISEFKFHEWRLERDLDLEHLRLPPDYRTPTKGPDIVGRGRNEPPHAGSYAALPTLACLHQPEMPNTTGIPNVCPRAAEVRTLSRATGNGGGR